jgi:two-component system phosphate regulon sensor histidine kinase PhoR
LAGIQEQCDRLDEMIQELLRLSRIESGQEVFTPAEVRLEDVIHESLDVQRSLAEGKSVNLEPSGPPEQVCVWTDQRALRTILDNLINNAVKYTPPGGRVVVAWNADEHEARIDVIDSGVGIPSDQLPRVFERFYRVDRSRNRAVGGTGLGLAIVKHLVEELGGRVEAQSTLDRGSTFSVWLPLVISDSASGDNANETAEVEPQPRLMPSES